MSEVPNEEWIRWVDDRLRRAEVDVRARPMDTMGAWSTLHGPIPFTSPAARTIFDWYTAHYPPGTFAIGSIFTGVFFFDQSVWPLHVPLGYGKFKLVINEMLEGMTALAEERLAKDPIAMKTLATLGADCIDYGYGFDDLRNEKLVTPLARNMLSSADKELRAAIEVLQSKRPSQKSAESSALAVEMFLKSYLAQHAGLEEKGARGISHRLDEGLEQCLAHDPTSGLTELRSWLKHLPKINDRYLQQDQPLKEMWCAYAAAQFVGACVIRSMTDRDCRSELRIEPPAEP